MKKLNYGLLKNLLRDFQRLAIGMGCVIGLGLGFYLAYLEKVGPATTCITAGIILFLLSNIELFESIKAPGIQATMRKIDAKVREVEELAEKVAKTSTVTAEFCMEIMARIGRMSGPIPRGQALRLVAGMSDQLLELGVEQEKIDRLLEPWRNIVILELLQPARENLNKTIQTIQNQAQEVGRLIPQPIDASGEKYKEYQGRLAEAGKLHSKLRRIFNDGDNAKTQVINAETFFAELTTSSASDLVENSELVAESLKHAKHYAEYNSFLNAEYWVSSDPMIAKDPTQQ